MRDVTTLKNHPERYADMAYQALRRGMPLGRAMTDLERLTLAVASCQPTHHLTVTSQLERTEFMRAFAALRKRIERRRGRPLIYIGTATSGIGDGGYHAHLLLWEYQHLPALAAEAREVGLGKPMIERLTRRHDPVIEAMPCVAYVLGQEAPVFCSRKHLENELRPPFKRRFLKPQSSTLEAHHPELLAAVNAAQDATVPDDMLLSRLPYLDRKVIRRYRRG